VSEPVRAPSAPHALYVAWGFPPFRGGGAYRTLATTNALAAAGFRVTVLTADRDSFQRFVGSDSSLEDTIAAGVDVVRVPFEWPTRDWDIARWSRDRAADPLGWLADFRAHETDAFPEPNFGPWHDALIAAAEAVHQGSPVDLVVGSANPNVDFAVGEHLHRRYGVPHVMDYRDAWRLDVYKGNELGKDDPRVAEFETRSIESAHEVWFVNEPIRAWHQEMYPSAAERMHVVENGFDAAVRPSAHLGAPRKDGGLRFAYVGTIGQRVPMAETVEGWIRATRLSEEMAQARADIWGSITAPKSVAAAILPDAEPYGVHYRGPVPKAQVTEVYEAADVLLLTLSAGRYVTSGKVYEYMATGLPIVSIHEPTNAASDVLRDYPLWVPAADLTTHAVADALIEGARLARTTDAETRQRAADFGGRFERLAQLEPVAHRLFDAVAGQGVSA
jgi:glycosyltransferase involved in cell wall biosynthesis